MNSYKIIFAFLLALGISSVAALTLRLTIFGLFLTAPAWPMAIAYSVLGGHDSPMLLPVSMCFGYLGLTFLAVNLRKNVPADRWRKLVRTALPLVVVLVVLACIPTLDPLFPRGMAQLRKKESTLAAEIHDGDTLEQVRTVLKSNEVPFAEARASEGVIFSRRDISIRASAGDREVWNWPRSVKPDGDAWQFPCRFDLQVVLVFGKDDKLRQHFIGEFPLCP